jgi:mRNA interferase RelE/StbE
VVYEVVIEVGAVRDLKRLPPAIAYRIDKRITDLAANPRPRGIRKLVGYIETWRLRVGDYRILYSIDDTARFVYILAVQPRPKAYK